MLGWPLPVISASKRDVLVHPPSLVKTEVGDDEQRVLKCTIAVADGRPDASIAESDDVSQSVTVKVDDESWVLVNLPRPRQVAEIGNDHPRSLKAAVAIAERRPHSAIAETDDIGKTAVRQLGEKPRVFLDAPSQLDRDIHCAPATQ